MYITRRRFVRNVGQFGKMSFLFLLTGSTFLIGCLGQEGEGKAGEVVINNLMKEKQKRTEDYVPSYIKLEEEGKFKKRVELAYEMMKDCSLCPRQCGVNRLDGEVGFCNTGEKAVVYSTQPHFGEEKPLVGNNGSGTIFFSNCNLRCVFCQNWPIAHEGRGSEVSDEELAEMMLGLQERGCHNINFVTPTHVIPNILNATHLAVKEGLEIPLCYNTSGYENIEQLQLLDDIVDIYLPDLKFMDGKEAEKYNDAEARDYPEVAKEAIIEMQNQVGNLTVNERKVAKKGLIIRHLVMPNRVSGPKEFAFWVADNLPKDTYVNIMDQYRVEHEAFEYEPISRSITSEEFVEAIEWAEEAGLKNIDERALTQYNRHLQDLKS